MTIKHAFVSAKPDHADATRIRTSNWNAEHVMDGLAFSGDLLAPHATKNNARIKAYSPAFELMNKDETQNWYVGLDDDNGKRFQIGRGYGPAQGIAPVVRIDPTDGFTIGNGDSLNSAFTVTSKNSWAGGDWIGWFRREGNATNNEALVRLEHFSNTQVTQPIFTGIANRGTMASRVGVSTDDYLLVLDGRGYDGSAVAHGEYAAGVSDTAAQIAFRVVSPWSGTSHPAYIQFKTTPAGFTASTEIVRMSADGSAVYPTLQINADGQVQLSIKKCVSSPLAPGAGYAQLRVEAGTNAGTLKIMAYAGTSNTGVLVIDNIGAGS